MFSCREKVEGEGGEAEEAVEQEEDPSAKEMTLDEYKAQHNVVRVAMYDVPQGCVCDVIVQFFSPGDAEG